MIGITGMSMEPMHRQGKFLVVFKTLLNDTAPGDVLELEKPSISARMGSMICTNLTRTLTEWQRPFGTNWVNNENGIQFGNLDIIFSKRIQDMIRQLLDDFWRWVSTRILQA